MAIPKHVRIRVRYIYEYDDDDNRPSYVLYPEYAKKYVSFDEYIADNGNTDLSKVCIWGYSVRLGHDIPYKSHSSIIANPDNNGVRNLSQIITTELDPTKKDEDIFEECSFTDIRMEIN